MRAAQKQTKHPLLPAEAPQIRANLTSLHRCLSHRLRVPPATGAINEKSQVQSALNGAYGLLQKEPAQYTVPARMSMPGCASSKSICEIQRVYTAAHGGGCQLQASREVVLLHNSHRCTMPCALQAKGAEVLEEELLYYNNHRCIMTSCAAIQGPGYSCQESLPWDVQIQHASWQSFQGARHMDVSGHQAFSFRPQFESLTRRLYTCNRPSP